MAAPRLVRAFVLALSFIVAACAGAASPPAPSATPTSVASPAPSTAPAPSAAPSPSPVAYPLTVTDDEGTSVTLATAPRRIVSLTPATTELLFALGLGSEVVGRTDADDYPPEASAVPTVASFTGVDVEKIVGADADLVIAGGNGFNPPEAIAKLRSLHVPVVVIYAKDVAGVLDDIELVGEATGAVVPASQLADSMRQAFDAIKTATASLTHPSVLYEIDASTGPIYTAADQSFLAEMLSYAGATPVTTGSSTAYDIPLEKLVTANPQIILLGDAAYGVTADQVKARSGWKTITAVQSGAIYPIDDVVVTRPGPRLVQGLLDLVRAIHPELDISAFESAAPSTAPSNAPSSAP